MNRRHFIAGSVGLMGIAVIPKVLGINCGRVPPDRWTIDSHTFNKSTICDCHQYNYANLIEYNSIKKKYILTMPSDGTKITVVDNTFIDGGFEFLYH